jgi:TFIIF-interacting CTD phosphatase-like protein
LDRPADFVVGGYHVYERPFLREFWNISKQFKLAIWTSASSSYAAQVISRIAPADLTFEFVWSCDRCVRRFDPELQETYFVKDLRKVKRLGFPLERTLVVDDSPEKVERNYGNHIRVQPFYGSREDDELRALIPYLELLVHQENFRSIEKRRWRQRLRA